MQCSVLESEQFIEIKSKAWNILTYTKNAKTITNENEENMNNKKPTAKTNYNIE